jgi:hypothetical protein
MSAATFQTSDTTLRSLGYVCRLRSLLAFGDLKLHRVTFLQALVAFGSDCTVMYKDVRAIRSSNEPIAFRVIEPLYGSFQTFHVPPAFCTSLHRGPRTCPQLIRCILERRSLAVKRVDALFQDAGPSKFQGSVPNWKNPLRYFQLPRSRVPVRDTWSSHSTEEIVLASRIVPFMTMPTAVANGTIRL